MDSTVSRAVLSRTTWLQLYYCSSCLLERGNELNAVSIVAVSVGFYRAFFLCTPCIVWKIDVIKWQYVSLPQLLKETVRTDGRRGLGRRLGAGPYHRI